MLATTIVAVALASEPSPGTSPKADAPAQTASDPSHGHADRTPAPEPTTAPVIGQPPILPDATLSALAVFTPIADGVWRVDGPADVRVEVLRRSGVAIYRYDGRMQIDTKLPVGYPQPTPPGVIEIKAYPAVRRAEVSGAGNPDVGMNLAFWPLFRHIDRNAIAMTAPVEIDYSVPALPSLDQQVRPEGWTMSFLYERETDGPAGEFGTIEVVDRDPVLVLALGLRGPYRYSRMQEAMTRLREWLSDHPEWVVAGDPRMLGYNGPERRQADQWSEMQVPIAAAPRSATANRSPTGSENPPRR